MVGIALLLLLATACTMPRDEPPMIYIQYLNPTSDVVDLRTQSREPNSDGGTSADVPPCGISGASWGLVERQTWSVIADGMVVLDSTDELPQPGPGEDLEVVLARHPDGTHTVESAEVHPHLSEAEWGARHEELRAELDC